MDEGKTLEKLEDEVLDKLSGGVTEADPFVALAIPIDKNYSQLEEKLNSEKLESVTGGRSDGAPGQPHAR